MQGNPYWPLKGPSFFESLMFRGCVLLSLHERRVGFRSNFAARMAKPTTELSLKAEANRMPGVQYPLQKSNDPVRGARGQIRGLSILQKRPLHPPYIVSKHPPYEPFYQQTADGMPQNTRVQSTNIPNSGKRGPCLSRMQ